MNWEEITGLLQGDRNAPKRPDFRVMRHILSLLGHPEEKLRALHVAGTNGKGSSAAMLQSILTESGYRCGLYISPHLLTVNERWSIDGEKISDARLSELSEKLLAALKKSGEEAGAFELLTLLAFLYFYEEACDYVVLEVGLGGRYDATNVIPPPLCALILSIGLDHTELLGNSIAEIAWEKAGILKRGGRAVLLRQSEEVTSLISKIAEEQGAELRLTDPSLLKRESLGLSEEGAFQCFSYRRRTGLRLSLLGDYQLRNASAVLDAVDILKEEGVAIPEDAVQSGLSKVRWPGRFELLSRSPLILLDGAHNPDGAVAMTESLRSLLPGRKIDFLMGVMRDKDYREMLLLTAPIARRYTAVIPEGEYERALPAERLAAEIRKYFDGPVEIGKDIRSGLSLALSRLEEEKEEEPTLLCFGSLYQVSEIRSAVRELLSKEKNMKLPLLHGSPAC